MVVGEDDSTFLSQRQIPRMAAIQPKIAGGELRLFDPHTQSEITVPVEPSSAAEKIPVTIWKDRVEAICAPEAGPWLSKVLDCQCQLVFMPETTRRAVNPAFARAGEIVSFADAYPILLIGEASITCLNNRLNEPVPVNRFRPNLIVSTDEPFAEDQWGELEIGTALLRGVKPCDRCSVPTIDQETGELVGPEPIRTLSTFRRFGSGVFFGQNLTVNRPGRIRLNDPITVLGQTVAMYG
jgi:uncharacterized protein